MIWISAHLLYLTGIWLAVRFMMSLVPKEVAMKCCPACGQTLPPKYPAGVRLSPYETRLFEVVRRAGKIGIGRKDIFDKLYADDPDGGPVSSSIICVRIRQINKKIEGAGMKIVSTPGNGAWWGGATYVLKSI